MRIITISRQFGSGGRELGKRLSDILGWDYYDREIIEKLALDSGLDTEYVTHVLNNHEWHSVPLTYRNSFAAATLTPSVQTELMKKQREIIEQIAAAGNDCIIVGRDADIILREYKPFRIFVCADIEDRVRRCMKHEEKKTSGQLTEREIRRNIRKIDKKRIQVRELLTGKDWGDASCFDITVNAGGRDLKSLSLLLSDFILKWFEEYGCK